MRQLWKVVLVAWGLWVSGVVGPGPGVVRSASTGLESVASFYRGKTVVVVVGYSAGGGYDLYARTLARYLGRYIPGNPTVIVQNMPGAGSLVAANHLYQVAPRDGSVFGIFDHTLILQQFVGLSGVQFDASRFNWIGSMTATPTTCIARVDSPVKRFEDLFTHTLRVGSSGPGSITTVVPALLNAWLGTRFEVVSGYQGSSDIDLAIERNEIQGRCGIIPSSLFARNADWVDPARPFVNILVQVGLSKHPALPHVPLIGDFVREGRTRELMEVAFATYDMARSFAAPPGVPPERVAALREAFARAIDDPELRADAQRTHLDLDYPLTGEQVQERVRRLLGSPREYASELAPYLR